MAEARHLHRQVERILDETTESQVEVIVQMESDRGKSSRLARAAGETLSRRRLSLTPRDLLPSGYRKQVTPRVKQETASTRTLMGRATAETLALAKIQQMGLNPMNSLLQSGIVRAALDRMLRPARRSARAPRQPNQFWTSRSMPLRLERDELLRLPEEVGNIKSIHLNHHHDPHWGRNRNCFQTCCCTGRIICIPLQETGYASCVTQGCGSDCGASHKPAGPTVCRSSPG